MPLEWSHTKLSAGGQPFHDDTDLTVIVKVLEDKRPPRAMFMDSLWGLLELCWMPQPNDRPTIGGVLQCLEVVSNLSEPPSTGVVEETEGYWDSTAGSSGVPHWTSTMMTERNTVTHPSPSYLAHRLLSRGETESVPSIVKVIGEADVGSRKKTGQDGLVSWTRQVSAT